MTNIFTPELLSGAEYIMGVYFGFAVVYIFNMIAGVIINCQITKSEKFSFGQFLLSFEKVLFSGIALFGLTVSTNLITSSLLEIEPETSELVTSVISLAIFALVFAKGFIQKTISLVDKLKCLFDIKDTSKQADVDSINSLTLNQVQSKEYLDTVVDDSLEDNTLSPLG